MYRVLIADDEPIERTVICKTIQKYYTNQMELVTAENGREAVSLFQENPCQIVILDIEMPGKNGLEAAAEIRKLDRNCSIIFLTAFDEFSYAKRAIAVKALDYLLKPTADEELTAVLDEAIRLADENTAGNNGTADSEQSKISENNNDETEDMEHIRVRAVQETILTFIREHYMEDISLQDAARIMNYSDAYFCKLFKHCFDKSFTTYLAEFRIEKAKQLLSDVTINIKEISDRVGYRDSNYFTKVFKRVEGMLPSEYRVNVLSRH